MDQHDTRVKSGLLVVVCGDGSVAVPVVVVIVLLLLLVVMLWFL